MAIRRPAKPARAAHRIIFVTGKGGVGKSTVAAATALQLARAGQRVLLAELGSHSFYGPFLGLRVGTEPVAWQHNLSVVRWDVESTLREYIAHYLVFKAAADKILNNTVMKALVAAAPSLSELGILAKITAPMRHSWYQRDVDVLVVDGYSTGQFLALLRAPRGLAATAASGPMHKHTTAITALLSDPEICEYRLVTLAEEMPISEACEMAAAIQEETGIAPHVYCNRMLTLPASFPATPGDSAAAPFVTHMQHIAQRQASALHTLKALGSHRQGRVQGLPLVLSDDASTLLDAVAQTLSDDVCAR